MAAIQEELSKLAKEQPVLVFGVAGGAALALVVWIGKRGKGQSAPSPGGQAGTIFVYPGSGQGSGGGGGPSPLPPPGPTPGPSPTALSGHRRPAPILQGHCPVGYTWDPVSQQCLGSPGPTPGPVPFIPPGGGSITHSGGPISEQNTYLSTWSTMRRGI